MPTEEQMNQVWANELALGIRNHDYSVHGSYENTSMGTPDIHTNGLMIDLKTVQVQSQIGKSRFIWFSGISECYNVHKRLLNFSKQKNSINRLNRKYEK